jgi:glycosyltransferase involved in cell wall biosynthesis
VEAAAWFRARGHVVRVICREQSRLFAAARARDLDALETPFGGDFDPFAVLRARKILKTFRADLAVVNFNKEAWQFGMAGKLSNIPVLARHGFPLFSRAVHHRILATRILSRIVVNADSIRETYRTLGLPVDQIRVIHNGTTPVAPQAGQLRARFDVADDAPLLVAAGRLESQKRFDRVLDIASALLPASPALRVLIAGDGPLREEMAKSIRTRSLEEHVRLVGFLEDFAATVSDADIFLLTSDEEGTPNVLLEAMMASVACVSFGVGSVPEILAGKLAENVIPVGDVSAMTRRVCRLLESREDRLGVADAMHARVLSEFTTDVSMRRFEELFESMISHHEH